VQAHVDAKALASAEELEQQMLYLLRSGNALYFFQAPGSM